MNTDEIRRDAAQHVHDAICGCDTMGGEGCIVTTQDCVTAAHSVIGWYELRRVENAPA